MTARAGTDVPGGFFYPFVGTIVVLLTALLCFAGHALYRAQVPSPEMEARLRAPALPFTAAGVELACANESRRRPVRLCVALNEAARPDAEALWSKASYEDRKDCLPILGERYDAVLALMQCLDPAPATAAAVAIPEFPVTRRSVEHGCLVAGGDVPGCIEANLAATASAEWLAATPEARAHCLADAERRTAHNAALRIRACLIDRA